MIATSTGGEKAGGAIAKHRYPSLYQINTRVWMTQLACSLGRPATLDDIPDADLDRIAEMGFDWIWLLSVWTTGAAGQRISRVNREWRTEFEDTLADLSEDDIAGSGFAITESTVHAGLGGDAALARLRDRLSTRKAWDGNWTFDCFVAALWHSADGDRRLIVVNYAGNQSQCYVQLPLADLSRGSVRLRDLMGVATYDRKGDELLSRGL